MKTLFSKSNALLLGFLLFLTFSVNAQETKDKPSPAAEATGKVGAATITINYSSPAVKGRTIWGDLVPYGKVWRTGANNATTFETDKDIKVEGKDLPAGKYSFFAIPGETEWIIIFNKKPDQWGAFSYDESLDALRVSVKPKKSVEMSERLGYTINKSGFVLSWENLDIPVSIK